MNTWIFQSVPERYDLREINNIKPGEIVTWYATRYRNEMTPGDIVYFWMGGEESIRGIYGSGVLTSPAYVKRNWDSHGVDVEIRARFKEPIPARVVKADLTLRGLLILRQPQATNFLLNTEEGEALSKIVKNSKEAASTRG